jgi:hypothetical protein
MCPSSAVLHYLYGTVFGTVEFCVAERSEDCANNFRFATESLTVTPTPNARGFFVSVPKLLHSGNLRRISSLRWEKVRKS